MQLTPEEQRDLEELLSRTPSLNENLTSLLRRLQDQQPTAQLAEHLTDCQERRSSLDRLADVALSQENTSQYLDDAELAQAQTHCQNLDESEGDQVLSNGTVCGPQRQTRSSRRAREEAHPYAPQLEANTVVANRLEKPDGHERARRLLRQRPQHRLPPCPRGGIQFVPINSAMDANNSATESEEAQTRQWENTSEPALTTGAAVHKYTSLLTSDLSHRRLLDVCRAVQASVTELQGAPVRQDESLRSLVARCACSLKLDAAASFWLMISHIRLAFRVARILELDNGKSDEGKLTVAGIWRREFEGVEGAPEKRTFQDWNTTGVKFARLAGGGSIYLLVLVAAQNLRVPLATANAHIAQDFGNLLRWPDDSRTGRLVKDVIIPAVARLRELCPIRLDCILPAAPQPGVSRSHFPPDLCGHLDASDCVFESWKLNSFSLVPRNRDVWRSCYDECDTSNAFTNALIDELGPLSPLTPIDSPVPPDIRKNTVVTKQIDRIPNTPEPSSTCLRGVSGNYTPFRQINGASGIL
ncbi:uncharacterized protein B0H18DRAFT_960643 [Fomitopsis serialis]|uniref:uncharacterized protein n=1 Tax=Fomitopsis serialis TaxID=139415 RepID=UPI0020088CED|nr:uncharacterized protein B0H18DRAFT_960643 [Neoantrodia serialis]KAH9913032.1 hypothetical protein B0H18DRAFT_960643 [Neoantrodia serialis]